MRRIPFIQGLEKLPELKALAEREWLHSGAVCNNCDPQAFVVKYTQAVRRELKKLASAKEKP